MKVMYLVNCSCFFDSHFLKLAEKSLEKGNSVYIVSGNDVKKDEFKKKGFNYISIPLSRGGTNIINEFRTIYEIYKAIKLINPDLLHMLTIKPIIYGGLVNKIFKFIRIEKTVASITGLGSASLSDSIKGKVLWKCIVSVYKFVLSLNSTSVIFENEDDRKLFLNNNITPLSRSFLVNGAGVDVLEFVPKDTNNKPLIVVLVARLLKDKGVQEYIDAGKILKENKCSVKLQLVGSIDKFNMSSMKQDDIEYANNCGYIEYLGQRSDIAEIYKNADIACLPSYREGLSKSLIEASSCGLAIITTDVPGCRQIVSNNNGILVPAKNVTSLVSAIQYMVDNPEDMLLMGKRSREMAVNKFGYKVIINSFFDIYNLPGYHDE